MTREPGARIPMDPNAVNARWARLLRALIALTPGSARHLPAHLSCNDDSHHDRHGAAHATNTHEPRWHGLKRMLPTTMSGLVASSTLLAITPLLVMLVVSGMALEGLLMRGEKLIADAQRIEVQGARLQDDLEGLERAWRQYLVLRDPSLLALIESRMGSVAQRSRALLEEDLSDAIHDPARELLDVVAGIRREWHLRRAGAIPQSELVRLMQLLHVEADRIVTEGRLSIYRQVGDLQRRSAAARQRITVATALALPLTLIVTWLLSRLITLPLQGLRASISALGTANYDVPVRIEYPRELARLGDKLEWLRVRLQVLQADKDRFLRHVSHELKTPLASLREGTDLLLEQSLGSLTPTQTEVAHLLAESAQDLDAQVRNLLAYAEWRSGQRDIDMNWIDTRILVDEVLRAHRLTLAKRRLRIVYNLRTPHLYGNRLNLRVSLSNLLSNAIKHAPADSAIDIVADRDSHGCCLSVRDRGRGVPEVDRLRILEPFVRGTEPEESGARGTGIGLSIVSETVKAHGGNLEVSDAEPGARFALYWPCPPASPC